MRMCDWRSDVCSSDLIYFPAGGQHLDGEDALIYARTRHDDGDAMRNERQQQVLLALREQAMNLDLISKAPELLTQLADTFRTDPIGRASCRERWCKSV